MARPKTQQINEYNALTERQESQGLQLVLCDQKGYSPKSCDQTWNSKLLSSDTWHHVQGHYLCKIIFKFLLARLLHKTVADGLPAHARLNGSEKRKTILAR